jgi:hypothetical protein
MRETVSEISEMPPELGEAGADLWKKVTAVLTFENPMEALALRQSCQLEDDLRRLRADLDGSALVTVGSTGQPVESPLLGSIRNAVALQLRLLQSIGVEASLAAERSAAGRRLVSHRYA